MSKNVRISWGVIIIALWALWRTFQTEGIKKEESSFSTGDFQAIKDLTSSFTRLKTGELIDAKEVLVKSEAKGMVKSIAFVEGQEIQTGQPVMEIEDSFYLYTQKLDEAKTVYDNAENLYEMQEKEYQRKNTILQQEITALEKEMTDTENQIFSLSMMNESYQAQQKELAIQKEQSMLGTIQNIRNEFQNLTSFSQFSQEDFYSEYQKYFSSESSMFQISSIPETDFLNLIERENLFLSKMMDCGYLAIASIGNEEEIRPLIAKAEKLQKETLQIKSDFQIFFNASFQGERQEELTALSQKMTDLETQLNEKNLTFETEKATQKTTMEDLLTAVERARNDYNNAYTEFNKLTARAPQKGILKTLKVNKGDFVEKGSLLFTLDTDLTSLVKIPLTFQELSALSWIEEAYFSDFTEEGFVDLTGTITYRSVNADEQGNYSITVDLNKKINNTEVVYLSFPLYSEYEFLPEDLFVTVNANTGTVTEYSWGKLIQRELPLWRSWNGYREVLTWLEENVLLKR